MFGSVIDCFQTLSSESGAKCPQVEPRARKNNGQRRNHSRKAETVTSLAPGAGTQLMCFSWMSELIETSACLQPTVSTFCVSSVGDSRGRSCLFHSQMSGSRVAASEESNHIQT